MAGEGAVGLIGDTRDSPTWANSALARGLFDATWTDVMGGVGGATSIRRLGDILNYAKTYMLGQVGQPGNGGGVVTEAARFDNYIYHVLGDPTLELWTSDPHQIWIPEFIEFYMPKPGEWVMGYHLDGATITALREGEPVARGLVVNGQAHLTQIGDGSVQRTDASPTFVASYPDGVSQVLKPVEAQGSVTPEEGGEVQDATTGFVARFAVGAAPTDVVVQFDHIDAPANPLPGGLMGLFHFVLAANDEDGNPVDQFAQAFSMHIPVNLNGRAAVDPNSLLCQVYVDGQWQPFQGQYDAQTGSLVCKTTQLGEFAATATQPAGAGQNSIFLPVVTR